MQSPATPVTCGEARRVPAIVLEPPFRQVDSMQTPGAAIVWLWSLADTAKLLKSAYVSSTSVRHVAAALPPGKPSKSATAVTLSTSLYADGTWPARSEALFPAATTYVTPAATERQIA